MFSKTVKASSFHNCEKKTCLVERIEGRNRNREPQRVQRAVEEAEGHRWGREGQRARGQRAVEEIS